MRVAAIRIPSLIALLGLAFALACSVARAADEAHTGSARKSAIRVGCGTLADSQGRTVSHEAAAGAQPARPGHCPGQTASPPPVEATTKTAPDIASSPAPAIAPLPGADPVALEPAPPPKSNETPPAARRAKAPSRPATPAPPPMAATPKEVPAAAQASPLETTRTTHAFGEPPRLALDPVGAGMALVAGGSLLWLLRSGFAASLLLLGLPVWRDIDLLPVVSAGALIPDADDERRAGDDADALFDGTQRGPVTPSRTA